MKPDTPPWKTKTRPCPFYSQGRCLFSESCNFLHSVTIRREDERIPTIETTQASPTASQASTPRSMRSPNRSPRMSSLLMALGTAIQQEEEDYEEEEREDALQGEESVTLVDLPVPLEAVKAPPPELPPSTSAPAEIVGDDGGAFTPESPHGGLPQDDDDLTVKQSRSSQAGSATFSADTPTPFQSPDNPSDGLLSPIEISSLPPICFPPLHSLQREDSIDSGYADGWIGPSPLLISPPRSPRRMSTLSILSSPFGSPTSRMLQLAPAAQPPSPSPSAAQFPESRSPHGSDVDSVLSAPDEEDEGFCVRLPVDPEPSASARNDDHFVDGFGFDEALQSDGMHAVRRSGSTPVAVAGPDADGDVSDPSIQQDDSFPMSLYGGDAPSSEAGSPIQFASADAIDEEAGYSLYAGYYSPEVADVVPSAIQVVSESSPRPELVRPPSVQRGRSGGGLQITLSEPPSEPPSSPTSSRASVVIAPAAGSEHVSSPRDLFSPRRGSVEGLSDRPVSGKVPFGFRHSSSSSNASKRVSGSLPPSRRTSMVYADAGPKVIERPASAEPHTNSAEGRISTSSRLKPLRLSIILNSASSLSSSVPPSSIPPSLTTGTSASSSTFSAATDQSTTNHSLSNSSRHIPAHLHHTRISISTHGTSSIDLASPTVPYSAPLSHQHSWHSRTNSSRLSRRFSHLQHYDRPDSRLSEPAIWEDDEDHAADVGFESAAIRRPRSSMSAPRSPVHAIATPQPTLLFALASDSPDAVKRVLEGGEAGPNDLVGPQSALAFAVTAQQLTHRMELVKLLLAHGADPSTLRDLNTPASNAKFPGSQEGDEGGSSGNTILDMVDPATRYYIARAQAPQVRRASALIHRSFFRPLAKVRYDLIGQDRVLEQLFRVLSMPSMSPIVVLLCGPSGHGKSLLARKFGSLLGVPTHTVNMTTLRSTHDIWRSYSMSPYEAPSTSTLADFLIENEGRRCVVVLDEIEKAMDEKVLSSLLMPWELGRCSFEAGQRHVDVAQVIWLGTSNIGHDIVFEHQKARAEPDMPVTREEYVDLMAMLRPLVSERLGASLLSRVTTVLPFVPFTVEEKLAIATEALYAQGGEAARAMPPATIDMIVRKSLGDYLPAEGARSLYRAISSQLLDAL